MATKMTREEAVALLERYSNYDGMGIPNLAGCKEAMKVAADALKEVYPELAESEDERIRRKMIEHFKAKTKETWCNMPVKDILAYLEKQKEYVSNNFDDVWDEEDCEEIIAEGMKLTPRFKELLKEVCHAWYDRGAKLEKQKEQKPAEWSDEDEKYLNRVINLWVNDFGEDSDTVKWLKSLRPQPKQEWSEEEKEILDSIFSHYVLIDKPIDANGISKEKYISLIKSIRFDTYKNCNSHWKPSEEQMKALYDACCIAFEEGRDFHPSLSRLYHDLMKL